MGKTLTGVSEAGNLLVYDVDALSSALLQVRLSHTHKQAGGAGLYAEILQGLKRGGRIAALQATSGGALEDCLKF